MKSSADKIKLTSFNDLFGISDDNKNDDENCIIEIPINKLSEFPNHPFYVEINEKMNELVESIKKYGVLMPIVVRKISDDKYEIISGHRRKTACEIAGKETIPALVRKYDDDEATILMVDSNIQRENIMPSEKARAYAMKYEALKHQGIKDGKPTLDLIGESSGESVKTVQRYIWLSKLNDELLEMVDNKKISIVQGIHISFLTKEEQTWVADTIIQKSVNISKDKSELLKEHSKKGILTEELVRELLFEEKEKERKLLINIKKISKFFSNNESNEEIENIIFNLLEEWVNKKKELK